MADIVITEFMEASAVDGLRTDFDVLYDPGLVDDRRRLLASLGDARAVIVRNRTQVDGELLAAGPALVAVGRLGVGLDNIDLVACDAADVDVYPATGANAAAVAEYVMAAVLLLTRGVFGATDRVVAGSWPRTELSGGEIGGRTMALVGFGGIARLVAAKASALGMTVTAMDPFLPEDDPAWATVERRPDLAALLADADAVSLHVPLTPDTRNLIDAAALKLLPEGAVLVNTARGGVVDEGAVVEALRTGALGGAALDVFAEEPLDARTGASFVDVPTLILTPHIAGITEESNRRVSAVTAANVRKRLSGGPA
ncbi:MAG TPA: NAD(P)-dependent oxidoreductase [Acidimicrobiia bacterium]|jgi:(S)-sulfolactate dehydrogenase|nr:NAD(P)-dependent oxidoreductase [Acidimicrobiia bacterium]